jgi:hypothetical protein|eukprot:COSAG01_NODE_13541_length_1569_cov_15.156463_4_plen_55_part_00
MGACARACALVRALLHVTPTAPPRPPAAARDLKVATYAYEYRRRVIIITIGTPD